MSRNIGQKKRFEVLQRDGFACKYCGQKPPYVQLEVDHIIPRSDGGTNEINNLITACFNCNRGKGSSNIGDDSKNLYKIKLQDGTNKLKSMFFTYWNKNNMGSIDKNTLILLYHVINSDMLFDAYKGFLGHEDFTCEIRDRDPGKKIDGMNSQFLLGGKVCDAIIEMMIGESYSSLLGILDEVLDDSIRTNIGSYSDRLNYCLTEAIIHSVELGLTSKYFLLKYTLFPKLVS